MVLISVLDLSSGSCPDGSENVDGKVVVVITGTTKDTAFPVSTGEGS